MVFSFLPKNVHFISKNAYKQHSCCILISWNLLYSYSKFEVYSSYSYLTTRRILLISILQNRWQMERCIKCFGVQFLGAMINSYLSNRQLEYNTTSGPGVKHLTSGAAQRSTLESELWNVNYDGILREDMQITLQLLSRPEI